MRLLVRTIFAVALLAALPACSVGMALSGSDNPDLGAIRVGASRGEVEMHLGRPVSSITLAQGHRADTYE